MREAVVIDLFDKTADEEIKFDDLISYDSLITEGTNVLLCTGWTEKKELRTKDDYLYHSRNNFV